MKPDPDLPSTVRPESIEFQATSEIAEVELEIRGLSKSFGRVEALRDVTFSARSGEVVGLLGDNGAGKSTLVKCLAGTIRPDRGEVFLDGEAVDIHDPGHAQALGIETVHQDLALVETLDVTANLFLNREIRRRGPILRRLGWMNGREMRRQAGGLLGTLRIEIPSLDQRVDLLSGGQRQAIAVGRAAGWGQRVVLLDEPAAALGVEQTQLVLDLVLQLQQRNLLVVLITHNMDHVMEVCTRAVVLRHGRLVADVGIPDVTRTDLVHFITGAA